ncbi:inactive protein FON2 SPARE1-like [Aristolochia californica]|uniref:inactive protein FON2 SPARE1-like n=1 Tax=Aristolochia californica TaxID=171875 RepID=UPI0035D7694D
MASAATLKRSHVVGILVWFSLILFFVHGWSSFRSSRTYSSSSSRHPALIGNQKSLRLTALVDLASYQIPNRQRQHGHHHHHHHHHHHRQHSSSSVVVAEADPHEIDPRYGVEKRLVPSGPNPLHH